MMRWVQAIWHRFEKIIRYLFCSIISTVFDVAIVWCLYHLAGVSLVVANTVSKGQGLVLDSRLLGLGAAAVALKLKAPYIVVVIAGALASAIGRRAGLP